MRVATETPGDYGTAYTGVRMAFQVFGAEETDDHYVITLSLRPQAVLHREGRGHRPPPGAGPS